VVLLHTYGALSPHTTVPLRGLMENQAVLKKWFTVPWVLSYASIGNYNLQYLYHIYGDKLGVLSKIALNCVDKFSRLKRGEGFSCNFYKW